MLLPRVDSDCCGALDDCAPGVDFAFYELGGVDRQNGQHQHALYVLPLPHGGTGMRAPDVEKRGEGLGARG